MPCPSCPRPPRHRGDEGPRNPNPAVPSRSTRPIAPDLCPTFTASWDLPGTAGRMMDGHVDHDPD